MKLFLPFLLTIVCIGCNTIQQKESSFEPKYFDPNKIGPIIESDVDLLNRSIHFVTDESEYGFTVTFSEQEYGSGDAHSLLKLGVETSSKLFKNSYIYQIVTSSPSGSPKTFSYNVLIKSRLFGIRIKENRVYNLPSSYYPHVVLDRSIKSLQSYVSGEVNFPLDRL